MTKKLPQDVINFYEPFRNQGQELKLTKVGSHKFQVSSNYKILSKIAGGSYGAVVAARDHTKENSQVAIKKIEKVFEHKIFAKRTLRELKQLRLLKHENIINIKTIILPKSRQQFKDIYAVFELMDSNLGDVIASQEPLTQDHVRFFLYQIIRGLKYIHSAKIVHRDLKPRNLLINSNCDLKICDFGMARPFSIENKTFELTDYVCSRWYRAPELLTGSNEYECAVDMWSVGCIFAEMLLRKPFLKGIDSRNQIQLIFQYVNTSEIDQLDYLPDSLKNLIKMFNTKKKLRTIEETFSSYCPLIIDLLKRLLELNPRKRITATEALKHPYFINYHLQEDEPIRDQIDHLEFEFEHHNLTTQQIKDIIYEEILFHNSEQFRLQYQKKIMKRQSVIEHILNNSNQFNIDPQADLDD